MLMAVATPRPISSAACVREATTSRQLLQYIVYLSFISACVSKTYRPSKKTQTFAVNGITNATKKKTDSWCLGNKIKPTAKS